MEFSKLIIGTMRLGTWGKNFSTEEYAYFIDACIERNLIDFDHADIYGGYSTEAEFGNVIRRRPELKNKIRLTTKCGIMMPCENRSDYKLKYYDSTAKHIRESVENSLRYLGVEKIDLLLIHRPDLLMDYQEIAACFQELRDAGKVLNFGVSNFTRDQLDHLNSQIELSNHQQEVSLTHLNAFEDGTIDWAYRKNVSITAWSPLGGGVLFGDDKDARIKRIRQYADILIEKYNCTLAQVLLAWVLKHPAGIIPVLGTSTIGRIDEALGAINIRLTREEWYGLLEASRGHEVA